MAGKKRTTGVLLVKVPMQIHVRSMGVASISHLLGHAKGVRALLKILCTYLSMRVGGRIARHGLNVEQDGVMSFVVQMTSSSDGAQIGINGEVAVRVARVDRVAHRFPQAWNNKSN